MLEPGKPDAAVAAHPNQVYRCLGCNAVVPSGAGFCPGCGTRIDRFYAPGEQLSPADANRQNIQRLLKRQRVGWWLLAAGLAVTMFSWVICR